MVFATPPKGGCPKSWTATTIATVAQRVADWRLQGADWNTDGSAGPVGSRGPQAPRYPSTIEHHYYRWAIEEGRVDLDAARRALRGEIETAVQTRLEQGGGEIDREDLIDELRRRYPRDEIERALAFLKRTGSVGVHTSQVITRD